MKRSVSILLWGIVCAAGLGYFVLANAMASKEPIRTTEEAEITSEDTTVQDEMNLKLQKTKRLQEDIKQEQENRMIKDVQKGMLR